MTTTSKDHDLIIAEIHQAITKLGGSAKPASPDDAPRMLCDLGADVDLRSILDSRGDTLPDDEILQMLRKLERRAYAVPDRLRLLRQGPRSRPNG